MIYRPFTGNSYVSWEFLKSICVSGAAYTLKLTTFEARAFLFLSTAVLSRQVSMYDRRSSSPARILGISSNSKQGYLSKNSLVFCKTLVSVKYGLKYLIYRIKVSFWISIRSLNWQKFRNRSELLLCRSSAIFFNFWS